MADHASDLKETRMELRAVSRKLSSCEQALEGHGAYLGIRDPATLLGQLQTLQKKEEQLRELLLILLRATPLQPLPLQPPPLQAPPPAANPSVLPPSTHPTLLPASVGTSAPPSRAPATTSSPRHRRPSQVEPAALRASARAGATASGTGAASASDSSAFSSSSPSGVFDPPTTGASKTVSLHEALGIPPSAKAGVGAGAGASSRVVPYRHGQHALYRLTAPPSGGNLSASDGTKESATASGRSLGLATTAGVGLKNRSGADPASSSTCSQGFDVASCSSGFGQTTSFQRTSMRPTAGIGTDETHGSRVCAPRHGVDEEYGDEGVASSSSSGDTAAEGEGSPPAQGPPTGAAAVGTVTERKGGGIVATSTADSNDSSDPTEGGETDEQQPTTRGAPARRVTVSRQEDGCGSHRSTIAAEAVRGEGATVSGEDQSPAAPATDVAATMEEDFTKEMEIELRRGHPRKFAGLTKATTSAAARAALAVASMPMAATDRAAKVLYKVKAEAGTAASNAMEPLPKRMSALLALQESMFAAQELQVSALTVWKRNFVVDEAERCVKRKSVDPAERLPAPRLPPPASSAAVSAGVAEAGTLDRGDQDSRHGNASPPGVPPPEVGVLRTTADAVVAPAGNLSTASPASAGGGTGDGSPQQQQQQQQQEDGRQPAPLRPPAADLSTEPRKTATVSTSTTANSDAAVRNGQGSGDAFPAHSCRPVRKRRKSAEVGGWSRYSKDDFVSGEALVLGSSSEEEDEEEGEEEEEEDYTFQRQRASFSEGEHRRRSANGRAGGGDGGRGEESDGLLVDVGEDDSGDDEDAQDDGVGTTRKRKGAMGPVKKRSPPNAWKRRCADGTCQLGASFAMRGEPAKYCSAHSDAGMVNVTHWLCMDPRCIHQPSYNMPGKHKAIYCRKHKRAGMINVTSPKCEAAGCIKRPSFAFLGDPKASFCETHKLTGMINVRKKPGSKRGGSSTPLPRQRVKQTPAYQSLPSAVGLEVGSSSWSSAAAAAAAKAKAAAALTAASAAGESDPSFDSPFLSDSPSATTAPAPAAATSDTTVTPSFASVLSSLGYNVTVRRPLGDGGGGGLGVGAGAERQ